MKRYSLLSVLVLMLAVFASGAYADQAAEAPAEAEKKGIEIAGVVQMTATVQAINKAEREIVLANDQGDVKVVDVGPEVKNFDQISVGDQLVIEFYESVALMLVTPGEETEEGEGQVLMTAEKGEKPAMVAADVQETMAKIVSIDKEKRKVGLQGPEGGVATVNVPPEVGNLENIKVGDDILIRYTEALAISIQSPE